MNHVLAIFKIPTTIANKFDAMISIFFWGNTKGIHWWKKGNTSSPLRMGGMGIRSVEVCNQALLMKNVLQIMNEIILYKICF